MSERTEYIAVWSVIGVVLAVWAYVLFWAFGEIGRLIAEAWVGYV